VPDALLDPRTEPEFSESSIEIPQWEKAQDAIKQLTFEEAWRLFRDWLAALPLEELTEIAPWLGKQLKEYRIAQKRRKVQVNDPVL
jgi:hypothetical protein